MNLHTAIEDILADHEEQPYSEIEIALRKALIKFPDCPHCTESGCDIIEVVENETIR